MRGAGRARRTKFAVEQPDRVDLLRVRHCSYWSGDPRRGFLNAIQEERLFALYFCAVVLGMRRGELLGMRRGELLGMRRGELLGMRRGELLGLGWPAVDLDAGRLTVRQTLTVINGRLSFEQPKARRPRRVVPLPAVVVDALKAHRERQEKERANCDHWTDSGLVFTTPGRPIPPGTLGKQWRDLRERVGLGQLRFHDLRHTCVSLLLALGVAPHVVREIAGHSDIKVTMTAYAHGNLDEHAAALSQLSGLLSGVVVNRPEDNQQDE